MSDSREQLEEYIRDCCLSQFGHWEQLGWESVRKWKEYDEKITKKRVIADSREELERKASTISNYVPTVKLIISLLDRQAAITRAECESNEKQAFREKDSADNALADYAMKLHACEQERDKWKDKAMELWCSRHDMLNMCAYASCNYKTCPLVLKGVEKDGNVSEITS